MPWWPTPCSVAAAQHSLRRRSQWPVGAGAHLGHAGGGGRRAARKVGWILRKLGEAQERRRPRLRSMRVDLARSAPFLPYLGAPLRVVLDPAQSAAGTLREGGAEAASCTWVCRARRGRADPRCRAAWLMRRAPASTSWRGSTTCPAAAGALDPSCACPAPRHTGAALVRTVPSASTGVCCTTRRHRERLLVAHGLARLRVMDHDRASGTRYVPWCPRLCATAPPPAGRARPAVALICCKIES